MSFPSTGYTEGMEMRSDVVQAKGGRTRLTFPDEFQGLVRASPLPNDAHWCCCSSWLILPVDDYPLQSGSFVFHRNRGVKIRKSHFCTQNGCTVLSLPLREWQHSLVAVNWCNKLLVLYQSIKKLLFNAHWLQNLLFWEDSAPFLSTPGPNPSTLTHKLFPLHALII